MTSKKKTPEGSAKGGSPPRKPPRNKELNRKHQKVYLSTSENMEKHKERMKLYYQKNKLKIIQRSKERYKNQK